MLLLGTQAVAAMLATALSLVPFNLTPTPTPGSPTPPTTPAASVSVTPSSVGTGGVPVTVAAVCTDGTVKAIVKSDAFSESGAFNGSVKITVKASAEARPGKYAVSLLCDGTTVSASTSLLIAQATVSTTPTGPVPTGPTPSGPPQTGVGSTSGPGPLVLGGVILIGAGTGMLAPRRRRQSGA